MARLPTDLRRDQLIELGITLFSSRPYEDVSIDLIAETAQVSRGLLYHYFGGKRAFYVQCLTVAADRLVVAATPGVEGHPITRARIGLTGWLRYVEERAPAFLAVMTGGVGTDAEVAAILDRTRTALADRVLADVSPQPDDPWLRIASRAWIGATERCTIDWLHRRDVPREALVDWLVHLLITTLSLATSPQPPVAPGER